ncbi:MAG TPA: hypothetical protein VF875_10600 [Anaeromyxobacter sp.]
MNSGWSWAAALAAAMVCGSCARSADAPDVRGDRLADVEAGAELAAHCAGELQQLVDEDPADAARFLLIEPIRFAPHGGAARAGAAVRQEIADRLSAARANAAAARTLAAVGADTPHASELSRERAARSLAASDALCRAAYAAQDVRFASRR